MNSDFIVAVHALVYLNHKADIVSSEALAKNICTNAARVRKVMAPLKRAGFVTTREGNVGGYRFAGDASAVDLHMVADALNIRFVQSGWHSGDMDMKCLVASGMAGIMDDIFLNTLFFVVGVSFAFFLLGFGFTALGQFFTGNQRVFSIVAGVIMAAFGLYMLGAFGKTKAVEKERRLPFRLASGWWPCTRSASCCRFWRWVCSRARCCAFSVRTATW